MRRVRWIACCLALSAAVTGAHAAAGVSPAVPTAAASPAKSDVVQFITIDGQAARHVRSTLFDCQSGSPLAGPIETDSKGSVRWLQVEDGKHCVRVERAAGSGSTVDVIDHNSPD